RGPCIPGRQSRRGRCRMPAGLSACRRRGLFCLPWFPPWDRAGAGAPARPRLLSAYAAHRIELRPELPLDPHPRRLVAVKRRDRESTVVVAPPLIPSVVVGHTVLDPAGLADVDHRVAVRVGPPAEDRIDAGIVAKVGRVAEGALEAVVADRDGHA